MPQGQLDVSASQNKGITLLKKKFAVSHGWPDAVPYELNRQNMELLKQIPGTFAAEVTLPDCPVESPIRRAYLDLLPILLGQELEGQWIVFGYDRNSYSVHEDPDQAMKMLVEEHEYQLPICYGKICKDALSSCSAQEYFKWKNQSFHPCSAPILSR